MPREVHILSADEIASLNKDGHANLSKDKFYAQFFLINDQPNTAADPFPFQIVPEALEKVASTAIGRPFVLNLDPNRHVRDPTKPMDPKAIIEYQKRFAAGEIVYQYVNPDTRNANVIVDIFPEYVDDVKEGRIPPYVSPLVENNTDGVEVVDGRLIVRDAKILHLQAVDVPGYGEVARIHGTCEGMLGECMNHLRTLGAAGELKQWQANAEDNEDNNSYHGNEGDSPLDSMAPQATSATTLTAEQIKELITSGLKDSFAAFEEKHSKILGASGAAAATEQVIESKPTGATDASGNAAQTENISDIKEHPEFKALQEKVTGLETAKQDAEAKAAREERRNQAMQIVEVELLSKDLALDKKSDRIKQLVDSKDDLSALAKYLQTRKRSILGASGYGDMAELTTDAGTSAEPVGFELEEMFK